MTEKLFYLIIGDGIPLICLHGYALDHTIWLKMSDELDKQIKIILPDLRGHGKSPEPPGKYSMRNMAGDILQMMDSLYLDNAYIAGHSMGGYIALALAAHYPERVKGLALVASHAFADTQEKKNSRLLDIERVKQSSPADVLSEMPGKLSRKPEVAEYCKSLIYKTSRNGVMGVLAGMAERQDSIDILNSMRNAKMLIAGTDDQLIPLDTSKEMASKIKGLQLIEIKNAGHMPMMEKPQDTAKAITNFLNKSEEFNQ